MKLKLKKRKIQLNSKALILFFVAIVILLLPTIFNYLQKVKFKSEPRADFEAQAVPDIDTLDGQPCEINDQYVGQCADPPTLCNFRGTGENTGFVGKVIHCEKNSDTGVQKWRYYPDCIEKEKYLSDPMFNCSRENLASVSNNPPEQKNDDVVETVQNTTGLDKSSQIMDEQTINEYKKYPCSDLSIKTAEVCSATNDNDGEKCRWATYKTVNSDDITGCVSNEFYDKVYCHFNNEEDCNKSNSPGTRCEWRLYSDNGLDKYGCRRIDWPEFTPIPKLDQPCNTYTSQEYCETLHSVNNQLQRNCMWSNDGGACYDLADGTVTTGNATSTQNSVWDNINAMLRRMLQR